MTPAAVALDSVEDWIMNGHEDETMDEYFARLAEAACASVQNPYPLRNSRGIPFPLPLPLPQRHVRDLRV